MTVRGSGEELSRLSKEQFTGSTASITFAAPRTSLAKSGHRSQQVLLVVDYYSRWIEIVRLHKTTSEDIILHTSSMFARHEIVVSDNGPQFSAESYAKFAQKYGFEHVTSSPHYPKGNREAERAVKTVKGPQKVYGSSSGFARLSDHSLTVWV